MSELFGKNLSIGFGGEVSILTAPASNRINHTPDQLLHAVFPLGSAERAAKIFRHDHVGSQLRPGPRNLDLVLFKNSFPLFARDNRTPLFPFNLSVGMDTCSGEVAFKTKAAAFGDG